MLPDRRRMPDGLMRFLYYVRYGTLVFFIALVGACGYFASKYAGDCSQDTAPPSDSPSAEAARLFEKYFYGMNDVTGFIVYIKSTALTPPYPLASPPQQPKLVDMAMDERFNHFDFHLEYWCKTGNLLSQEYINTHQGNAFYAIAGYNSTTDVGSYSSYRAVMTAGLPVLAARQYISPGNQSVSLTITYSKLYKEAATSQFAASLEDHVSTILSIHGLTPFVAATVVSLPTFLDVISGSIVSDLYRMFLVVIPIALVVFGLSLSSGKLLLLPIAVLAVAMLVSAAIMDGVAAAMEVNSLSPGVLMTVVVAFTLDYTYFIASQWRREMVHLIESGICHADEVDLIELMKSIYATAGKTIFISCHTIALCSVGITFFSVDLIRSIGVTVIVTAEVTGMVALLLPVAMLVSFPGFFFATLEKWCNAIQPDDCVVPERAVAMANDSETNEENFGLASSPKNEKERLLLASPTGYGGEPSPDRHSKANHKSVIIAVGEGEDKPHKSVTKRTSSRQSKRMSMIVATRRVSEMVLKRETAKAQSKEHLRWAALFQLAEFITGYPQRVVFVIFSVAVLATMLPFAVSPEYSNSINQYIPRGASVLPGWNGLKTDFRAGSLFTYTLIVDYTGQGGNIADVFLKQQNIVWTMINELPETYPRNFDGPAFSGVMSSSSATGGNISYSNLGFCYLVIMSGQNNPECVFTLLTYSIFQPSLTGAEFTYMLISLDWDPSEGIGHDWYTQALALLDRLETETGFKLHLRGYAAETFDTIAYAKNAFTTIIIVTVAVLFCCMFLAFGSLVIALVVLSSVTLTVVSCFGSLTLIYQYGGFGWTDWEGLTGTGAIAWQIPFTSFLMSAAVALNYEIIYVTKVFELRWKGFDTRTAIVLSMTATIREVSVGAVMMVITFLGLLLSDVSAMNQIGFVFAATAIAEAFVVRLFFTPPLMALLGHYNWFPLQYCPAMFTPPVVGAVDAGAALEDVVHATGDKNLSFTAPPLPGTEYQQQQYTTTDGSRHTRESASGAVIMPRTSAVGHRPHFTKEEDEAAQEVIAKYRRSVLSPQHVVGDEHSMRFSTQVDRSQTAHDSTTSVPEAERVSYSARTSQQARLSTRDSYLQQIAHQ